MATSKEIAEAAPQTKPASKVSLIDRFLGFISSVPFGVSQLVLLIVLSMIGMLIQQQELETFRDYYNKLTPAERMVYGNLGFFNIYHVWYFNLLLLVVSLNIILASIDYFPKAWLSVRRKKLKASPTFVQSQKVKETVEAPKVGRKELVERAVQAARAQGFKTKVTESENQTTIFAEKGVWNRFGAYYIHVGLLTIFLGGFLTSTRGVTGSMWLEPGKTDARMTKQVFNLGEINQVALDLPFEVECTDFRQRLIDQNKGIETSNTLDWLTSVRIKDKQTGQVQDGIVHMNKPLDYRGYRFFQASVAGGGARMIELEYKATPTDAPQKIRLSRTEEGRLADGTRVRYVEFFCDAQFDRGGRIGLASNEYNNPAAHLEIISPNGDRREVWAFNQAFLNQTDNAPFLKTTVQNLGGSQFVLKEFEKASAATMLSIQRDPGSTVFYLGSAILGLALLATFLFAHQRLWIVIEDGKAYLGGDANRNKLGFEDRVKKIAARISEPHTA
jgi:cytochrome c biogenesis protein